MFCFQSCIFTNRSISRKFCRKKNSNRSLERAFRAFSLANELKPWLDISKVHFELLGISRLVLSLDIRLGLKACGLCRNLSLNRGLIFLRARAFELQRWGPLCADRGPTLTTMSTEASKTPTVRATADLKGTVELLQALGACTCEGGLKLSCLGFNLQHALIKVLIFNMIRFLNYSVEPTRAYSSWPQRNLTFTSH